MIGSIDRNPVHVGYTSGVRRIRFDHNVITVGQSGERICPCGACLHARKGPGRQFGRAQPSVGIDVRIDGNRHKGNGNITRAETAGAVRVVPYGAADGIKVDPRIQEIISNTSFTGT